jgi:steroid 5-alpha reductase family enzyme
MLRDVPGIESRRVGRRLAFALCGAAYVVAAGGAMAAGWLLRDQSPLVGAAVADLAATVIVFGFSVVFGNSSLYDPYWSVAPVFLTVFWAAPVWRAGGGGARPALVLALVTLWSVRLTYNWARQWGGLAHEDWRYVDLRRRLGCAYWPVSFLGIHLMPTILVFLGCLSSYVVAVAPQCSLGVLDAVAALVTASAIGIEAAADQELRRFAADRTAGERSPSGTNGLLASGLWASSRHPNYFGEILFWWGLWLFAVAARPAAWWSVVGPLVITALFLFISIPMMERHLLARRPAYAEYQRRVSRLLPWFPKSSRRS